jgi:predicted metal-dependent HD superfamily phosphohydrolase
MKDSIDLNFLFEIMREVQEHDYPRSRVVDQFIGDVIEYITDEIRGAEEGERANLEEAMEHLKGWRD